MPELTRMRFELVFPGERTRRDSNTRLHADPRREPRAGDASRQGERHDDDRPAGTGRLHADIAAVHAGHRPSL